MCMQARDDLHFAVFTRGIPQNRHNFEAKVSFKAVIPIELATNSVLAQILRLCSFFARDIAENRDPYRHMACRKKEILLPT